MDYKLVKSKRKTLEISINDELEVIVKAPDNMPQDKIEEFVVKNKKWIEKHIERKRESLEKRELSDIDETLTRENALQYLTERTKFFSDKMGLKPTGIKITSAKKRFGSCNYRNSICYSWYLMLYPPEAIDYVVVHELAHIRYKNHGKEFYKLIEKYLPDYKERVKMLK